MKAPTAVASSVSPIQALLDQLHARFATLGAGKVADYIPELAKADPTGYGIVIATVDRGLLARHAHARTPSLTAEVAALEGH